MKRKILIFTPGGVGGAERMSVLIGKILPKDIFEVKYVVVGRLRNIYNILPNNLQCDCIPVRNIYAFSTFRIWWKILKEKPDVVFTSQAAYNSRVIIASRLASRKIVVRSSGMVGTYRPNVFRGVKLTYKLADVIIAQQNEMRNEIVHLLKIPSQKVITIHNPLDYENIKTLSSVPSPYPNGMNINFVEVASVNHRKAQDIAIKAFPKVKKSIPNAHLYFIGKYEATNSYFKELTRLLNKLCLNDCVHFMGYDKNPYKWIKNSNCFVLPSRNEGLPNALIEASFLGIPCAATRCLNVVDDIIKNGENGYVVNVDDVDGMANAMIKACLLKDCKMNYSPGTIEDFANVFYTV